MWFPRARFREYAARSARFSNETPSQGASPGVSLVPQGLARTKSGVFEAAMQKQSFPTLSIQGAPLPLPHRCIIQLHGCDSETS